jgi:hypothetical protein
MPTVASVIEHLKGYKPDEHIATAIWCEEDVLGRAEERDMVITREQAQSIIDQMDANQDAELGITWDTIDAGLDELPSKPEWPCRYCENLIPFNKPRQKYVGGCKFGLDPEACGKFELAKCYEGHDPREPKRTHSDDDQLPESIATDGSMAV